VGPMSQFAKEYGSSSLIKSSSDVTNGILALGVPEEIFKFRFCVDNKIITFPAHVGPFRVSLFDIPMPSLWYGGSISNGEDLLSLPEFDYDYLVEILEDNGAVARTRKIFDSCSTETLAHLPNIKIEVGHILDSSSFVIRPSDYVTVINDSCHMRISTHAEPGFMGINFFGFVGLNARIARDTIILCHTVF